MPTRASQQPWTTSDLCGHHTHGVVRRVFDVHLKATMSEMTAEGQFRAVVLLGPPGVGKSLRLESLKAKFPSITFLSVGNTLRE